MTRDDSTGGWVPMGGGGLSNVSVRKRVIFEDERKPEYVICGKRISDQSPSQPSRRRAFWREELVGREEDAVEEQQMVEEDKRMDQQEDKTRQQLQKKQRQLLKEKQRQLLQEKEQLELRLQQVEKELHEIQEAMGNPFQKDYGKEKEALCSVTFRLVSIVIMESTDFNTTENIRNLF